jgi:hypothetical protein
MATRPCSAFAIPYFRATEFHERYLSELVDALVAQSVTQWRAVIAVDGLKSRLSGELDARLRRDGRFAIIQLRDQVGVGPCRNAATRWCLDNGADFILFQDADDIPHPERVDETTTIFSRKDDVDFIYSAFDTIDENGDPMPYEAAGPMYQEFIEASWGELIQGPNAWIRIGTETGAIALTSTVAVRARLAAQCLFPAVPVSEDVHTFYRMSAAGTSFGCSDIRLTKYRLQRSSGGGSTFAQYGDSYYRMMMLVDLDGFSAAMRIALERGTLPPDQAASVMGKFYDREAQTMERTGDREAADLLRGLTLRTGEAPGYSILRQGRGKVVK